MKVDILNAAFEVRQRLLHFMFIKLLIVEHLPGTQQDSLLDKSVGF